MSDEPRYTLEEAKLEIARRQCAMNGHDFELVMQIGKAWPTAILCERCGEQREVGFVEELREATKEFPWVFG